MKQSIAELAKYYQVEYDKCLEQYGWKTLKKSVHDDYPWEKYDVHEKPINSSIVNVPIDIRKDVHLPMLSLSSRHVKLNKVVKGEVITAKELLPDDCNSYLFG